MEQSTTNAVYIREHAKQTCAIPAKYISASAQSRVASFTSTNRFDPSGRSSFKRASCTKPTKSLPARDSLTCIVPAGMVSSAAVHRLFRRLSRSTVPQCSAVLTSPCRSSIQPECSTNHAPPRAASASPSLFLRGPAMPRHAAQIQRSSFKTSEATVVAGNRDPDRRPRVDSEIGTLTAPLPTFDRVNNTP